MSFLSCFGNPGNTWLGVPPAKRGALPLELHFNFLRASKLFVDNAPAFASTSLYHLLQLQ